MSVSTLKNKIQKDMAEALRAKDTKLLSAIRLLWAAIRQREIDERIELDDGGVLAVIDKMIKQRCDSIEQYRAGNRLDLVATEDAEIKVLQTYLPPPMDDNEIDALIKSAISESAAGSVKDIGKVMAIIKPKVQGRADIGKVSAKVKSLLQ
jgi:uncharacterized protein